MRPAPIVSAKKPVASRGSACDGCGEERRNHEIGPGVSASGVCQFGDEPAERIANGSGRQRQPLRAAIDSAQADRRIGVQRFAKRAGGGPGHHVLEHRNGAAGSPFVSQLLAQL
ncbi:MAG: hypothetical protein ABI939_10935, partial [Anaerolineaceae bacterium]